MAVLSDPTPGLFSQQEVILWIFFFFMIWIKSIKLTLKLTCLGELQYATMATAYHSIIASLQTYTVPFSKPMPVPRVLCLHPLSALGMGDQCVLRYAMPLACPINHHSGVRGVGGGGEALKMLPPASGKADVAGFLLQVSAQDRCPGS